MSHYFNGCCGMFLLYSIFLFLFVIIILTLIFVLIINEELKY